MGEAINGMGYQWARLLMACANNGLGGEWARLAMG